MNFQMSALFSGSPDSVKTVAITVQLQDILNDLGILKPEITQVPELLKPAGVSQPSGKSLPLLISFFLSSKIRVHIFLLETKNLW